MIYTHVSLCRINGLSCFGCCGHKFAAKEEIVESLRKNNIEYKHKKSLTQFMQDNSLRETGVCRKVVTLKDGTLGCPGHPKQARKELRKCDILYECKINFLFNNEWNKEQQQRFLEYIKTMDDIEYSLFMSDERNIGKVFLTKPKFIV